MKTLWHMISFLAVVNLLALTMFVGWLRFSGRLNEDRVEAIREMLSPTIAEVEQAQADAQDQAEIDARDRIETIRRDNPMPPSDEQIHFIERANLAERDRIRRIESEVADLRRQLLDAQAALARDRAAFEQERAQWDQTIAAGVNAADRAQFQRVVGLLEQIPARQAKDTLAALMAEGKIDDAVAYLNAMKPFNAAEVIKSFKGDEQNLATELLQRMKELGQVGGLAGPSSDAGSADSSG